MTFRIEPLEVHSLRRSKLHGALSVSFPSSHGIWAEAGNTKSQLVWCPQLRTRFKIFGVTLCLSKATAALPPSRLMDRNNFRVPRDPSRLSQCWATTHP